MDLPSHVVDEILSRLLKFKLDCLTSGKIGRSGELNPEVVKETDGSLRRTPFHVPVAIVVRIGRLRRERSDLARSERKGSRRLGWIRTASVANVSRLLPSSCFRGSRPSCEVIVQ